MEKRRKSVASIFDIVEVVAISIVVVIVLFTFIFRLSTVDGRSMFGTLVDGERVLVSSLFYTPKNEDIVVFQQADGYFKAPLVKRVIAVGGDTLRIDFANWRVYVNDELVDEYYITKDKIKPMKTEDYYTHYADMFDSNGTITIPEGYIFVMGDNRNDSSDSRFSGVGLVSVDDVMGKVFFRISPLSKIGKVN